jgi:SAM-dependent methyltransferase
MNLPFDLSKNEIVWRQLYAQGQNDLRYPNDVFVRCCYRYLDSNRSGNILDFGFGTGANLIHLAQLGYTLSGIEISEHALHKTRVRLENIGLRAELHCIEPGSPLPWESEFFDAVVAWQVLYYNDWDSWRRVFSELDRVLRPGGVFIGATAAPGDISQTMSEALGGGLYRSKVPGQEGCILAIPDEPEIANCFPGREIELGEFSYRLGEIVSRHWVVVYRKD